VFELIQSKYQLQPAAPYQATAVGLSLRLRKGSTKSTQSTWLRWADPEGNVIPTGKELAGSESQRATQKAQRAAQEAQRANRLAAKLRELGVDPDLV